MAIGAIVAGVSAAVGLGTSLFGNNSSANDDQERAQISQRKNARRQARELNAYNKKKDAVVKENYYNNRDYAFDTAVKAWERNKEIEDFQYKSTLDAYNARASISQDQLGLNAEAAELGIATTRAAFKDFEIDQAFQRESIYADLQNELINQGFNKKSQEVRLEEINTSFQNELINQGFNKQSQEVRLKEIKTGFENQLTDLGLDKLQQQASLFGIQSSQRIGTERIQTELKNLYNRTAFDKEAASIKAIQDSGQAALGQAGKSRGKSIQSAQAESFRTLTQLESALKGSRRSAGIQLLNLNVDSAVRETGVNLSINKLDEAARFAGVRSGLQTEQVGIDIARIDEAARFAGIRSGLQTKQVGIDIAKIDQAISFANEEAEFNNRILQANRESRIAQTERDIATIKLRRRGKDLEAEAAVGIMPTQLEYAPFPEIAPEQVFLKSRKVSYEDILGPQAPIPSGQPSTGEIIQQGLNLGTAGVGIYEAFNNKTAPTPPGNTEISAGVPLSTGTNATNRLNNFLNF